MTLWEAVYPSVVAQMRMPPMFEYWIPTGRIVWGKLGGVALLEELCHCGVGGLETFLLATWKSVIS